MFRSSTNFDKLLDKATSNLQLEPDWPTIMQICDLIRQSDVQPKVALSAIRKKMINSNPHIALYALLVLESCVKNCGTLIHDEIATKQYMEQLKELVKTSPHENVRMKTLELIQAWAHAFRNSPKYRTVQDTLNIMKAEGYQFPILKESDAMFRADTAPAWADGEVCHRCRVTFSMVQRKHHCRACGQVFCAQCSSKVSTLPKFGIEKEVRVCVACYEQVNKPSATQTKDTDLPVEYLKSTLAQQQQVPVRKTEEELQEEEELNLAIALSQSEAEQKEKEKKRAASALKSNNTSTSKLYSPPPSPGPSPLRVQDDDDIDPELAKYLNRKYWEQRQTVSEEHASRTDVTSPSAPNISSPMPQKIALAKQENGEIDTQMEEFVSGLRSQVEIFVNRMKSNSSRGRSIANDSSVQTLFMNITAMHSRLLRYIQEQDDSRVYYEGLQDKLTQMKDARAALDALREEHKEKLRRRAEEAERQRQMLMAQKLAIMRKKKQEYLQYQRQLALRKIQEQEREMQMRQEQQKQQYIMGGYQAVSDYIGGPSQGSPVRHVHYATPGANYPMSPTNQGVYMYGQSSPIGQYAMQGYNMPPMNTLPVHMMPPLSNPEQQSTDPSIQGQENLSRVSISGPGMMPPQMPPIQQLQPPSNHHQMGPQQVPSVHVSSGQVAAAAAASRHISPQQTVSSHIPQQTPPPTQVGLPTMPQSHVGLSSGPGTHVPGGGTTVPVGLPLHIRSQQPSTLPVSTQGSQMSARVSSVAISSQSSSAIQVPGGAVPATSQALSGPQTSGIPAMQGISAAIPTAQTMPYQPAPPPPPLPPPPPSSVPTTASEAPKKEEDVKPTTAELISFD